MDQCIQHFSHEHPLNFFQVDDLDDPKPYRCCICGLPILSSPSYTCSIDANCNFFVHKACTQLPEEWFSFAHLEILNLERPTLSPRHSYKCRKHPDCEFELHPLLVKPVEIETKHISHKYHPLKVCCREIVSICDACGEKEKGFFFNCQGCNFWIHQDCTILPTIVKLSINPHPYILSYSPPFNLLQQRDCSICRRPWRLYYNGVYFQGEVYDMVHVACAKSKMENLTTETMQEFNLELPDEEDTFPSLVIRRSAERNPPNLRLTYHKHPLMILEDGSASRKAACGDLVCDVCIQPIHISSSFYRCQSDGCHFLAHDICAYNLPSNIQFFYSGRLFGVHPILDSYSNMAAFNSVFPCILCFRPSNGIVYALLMEGKIWSFCDAECALAPKIIKHASHRQHLLFQFNSKSSLPVNCCSRDSLHFDIYICVLCNFSIHNKCALLPKKTRHKFDEHPLMLIMSHDQDEDNKQVLFCEVCEQEIELKLWYYGCHECVQYFHVDCIPSVGHMSKVKFGKTHVDYQLHQHPLTLTRMLTHERHEMCAICKSIIKGFSDDQMAFHCSLCDFWVHFSCASATTTLLDYSKYLASFKKVIREYKEELP